MTQNTKTPVMVLQELTVKRGLAPPDYQIVFQESGTHANRFDFMVTVAGVQAKGSGPSKQISKHQAAHNALQKLREIGLYNPIENPVAAFKVLNEPSESSSSFQPALNCIVELQIACTENKLPPPGFFEIASVGPPHNKEFTFECKIASITTQAKASTKKLAKQLAAKEMLNRLKNMLPDLQTDLKEISHAIVETEAMDLQIQQAIHQIIPDKSLKITELPNTLVKLMSERNLSYEDFKENLKMATEDSLQKIVNRLDIGYSIRQYQVYPPMAIFILKIDTPFTVISSGQTYDQAKQKALAEAFEIMGEFMKIRLSYQYGVY